MRGVVLALALACAGCLAGEPARHSDPTHAIAIAYVREPLQDGFVIDGDFTLPRDAANRGWYTQWFTYTGKPSQTKPNPAYLQAGLVRNPRLQSTLESFVAYRPHGGDVRLRTLGTLGDGPHRLTLASQRGTLSFGIDGKQLFHMPATDFYPATAKDPYLQIGHELSATSDTALGTITSIRFSADGLPQKPLFDGSVIPCYFYSNGVRFNGFPDGLSASGTFDPNVTDYAACPA